MSSFFTIQLNQLRFTAPHGLFAEEALTGNSFEVNISITVEAPLTVVTSLHDTINYAEVFGLVKEVFSVRKDLLETLAMEIAERLKERFPAIRETAVDIRKLNPPIAGFTGSVSVTYHRTYED